MKHKLPLVTIASIIIFWAVSCSTFVTTPQTLPDISVTTPPFETTATSTPVIASPSAPTLTPTSSEPLVTASLVEETPIEYTRCDGPITGIIIMVPSDTWTCTVELLGDNETIHLISPLFTIEMSTLGRGSFCEFPGQDESCVETPFYENKYLSLSTWSSYGEIKEIFGVIRTEITGQNVMIIVSVKYIGMEKRELTLAEKQELIDLFDSISFEK